MPLVLNRPSRLTNPTVLGIEPITALELNTSRDTKFGNGEYIQR
jgi:hypothetical protein